jgi:hypothetical protein
MIDFTATVGPNLTVNADQLIDILYRATNIGYFGQSFFLIVVAIQRVVIFKYRRVDHLFARPRVSLVYLTIY